MTMVHAIDMSSNYATKQIKVRSQ